VETNIPRSLVPSLVEYARTVDRSGTYRAIVTGRKLIWAGFDVRGYIFHADFAAIRARADRLFPPTGTLPPAEFLAPKAVAGRPSGSGVSGCLPAATPKPTATPKPKPTATPAPSPSGEPTPTGEPTPSGGPTPLPVETPPPVVTPVPEPTPTTAP